MTHIIALVDGDGRLRQSSDPEAMVKEQCYEKKNLSGIEFCTKLLFFDMNILATHAHERTIKSEVVKFDFCASYPTSLPVTCLGIIDLESEATP